MVYTERISAGQCKELESFTWYITCSDMSTLQSPILNMSTSVKKSSRLGRESNNVFHFKHNLQRKHNFQLFSHSAHFEMEREEQDNFPLLNQVSTVVFTLRDGLFDAYYFKCDYFLLKIYLSRVSLMNLQRILIIHCVFATEYCARCSKRHA